MGALINVSLNLDKLDKTKIIKGKNGNYYNITVSVNDEVGQYGDNISAYDSQTREQRQAKETRNYVGSGKVFWTDGKISAVAGDQPNKQTQPQVADVDLPF